MQAERETEIAAATLLPRLAYVAYPTSLALKSANAVQTFATARELGALLPDFELIVPRFARRPSAFAALGATHLARIPFNVGRNLFPTIGWSYAERTWFAGRVLARLLRWRIARRPADVIYVRDAVCAAWLALLARYVVGAQVVYEIHDLEAQNPSANSGPITRRLAPLVDRFALRHADRVVSLTRTFADLLRDRPALTPNGPIAVIPDAYDDGQFFPRDRAEARAALVLPADAFIVAYTGLTWKYHGVDRAVDAFALLLENVPAARLLLVGGRDSEREEIRALSARLGIADAVQIVPPVAPGASVRYVAAADAVVFADTVSKESASPLKFFEYAACARPIVAVDLPALREILPDDAARYVPAGDTVAFAAALRWVAEHRAEAAAMAEHAAIAVRPYTYRNRAVAIVAVCTQTHEGRR